MRRRRGALMAEVRRRPAGYLDHCRRLSFDGEPDQQTPATWTVSGIADLAPGNYVIQVTVTTTMVE